MTRRTGLIVLAGITVITAFAVLLISRLNINYDFEAYFPQDHPETAFYKNFRKTFETDNDFFIIGLENQSGAFDLDFLRRVDSLTSDLEKAPYMVEVASPTRLKEFVRDPFIGTVFEKPLLRLESDTTLAADSARVFANPGIIGAFFSADGKSVAINIKHEGHLSKSKSDELAVIIPSLVEKYAWDKSHVIGRALGQKMYVEMMVNELLLFISVSLLLTILFLFIAFRSGWGIVIPTLVVLISITWTMGFVKLIGNDVDLMMTILPTIIFVVGMSDSVHVLTKYLQELRNGREKIDAIRYAFKSIRLATFLTALTTSIGFLTLMLSNIEPISNFGLYTSVGVMLAYGLTYTMLPAILILAKPKRMMEFALNEDFWTRKLHGSFRWLLRHRRRVMWAGLLVLGLSGLGISLIKVDNLMLEDLRENHPLKVEFRYMENDFSGCRPFEAAVEVRDPERITDLAVLQKLDTIETFLRDRYGVGTLWSVNTLIKTAHRSMNGGLDSFYALPETQEEVDRLVRFMKREPLKELSSLYISPDSGWLRISGKVPDLGRVHYDSLNVQLQSLATTLAGNDFDIKVTGTAQLIDLNNRLLVENMVWDLLLSVLAIGLIMGFVYSSWRMVILTILPNLFPLLIVAGIMGFSGIPIKVSTSIIFNIAFGIAVDDTIHFLARTRTLLGTGLSLPYAIKRTFLTTGKAMIVTTIILSGGFLTLVFSDFLGTFYIGFLISLTLFVAIVAELMFSPLIVMYFYRTKPHKDLIHE